MMMGAERMCMPSPSVDQFVQAVKATVLANERWIPPPGKGSLYIRPLLMGSGSVLGLAPAPEYTFLVYVSPVGNYFKEMFGKDALANEQASEDEDWGPTNRKRREKESDAASTLMTLCETEEKSVKDVSDTSKVDTNLLCEETNRSFFRIPAEAVEKLRLVFAKNELPSRAVKEELSKELGLDPEKVNKWFKNTRYLSLKTRKTGEETPTQNDGPSISIGSGSEPAKNKAIVEILSENMPTRLADTPRKGRMKKFRRSGIPSHQPVLQCSSRTTESCIFQHQLTRLTVT